MSSSRPNAWGGNHATHSCFSGCLPVPGLGALALDVLPTLRLSLAEPAREVVRRVGGRAMFKCKRYTQERAV